jgi:hypothetical protein
MNARELRVGRTYAYPTSPGPWYRVAVPARVMSHGPRNHVLVLLPHGIPAGPTRDEVPRAALVWLDAASIVSSWDEWPARAASAREDMAAVVASAVAAIGGPDAPTITGPRDDDDPPTRWWSRPIQQLLRPPALPVTTGQPRA